jgi:hypothetical protein
LYRVILLKDKETAKKELIARLIADAGPEATPFSSNRKCSKSFSIPDMVYL